MVIDRQRWELSKSHIYIALQSTLKDNCKLYCDILVILFSILKAELGPANLITGFADYSASGWR